MEKSLAIQKEVQRTLSTDEIYLCGGAVRDLVMGNTPKDYDFTTPILPEKMIDKVKAAGRRVYTIGEKFGTIGFKVEYTDQYYDFDDNELRQRTYFEYVEVTTFRSEVYTNKSRKPEVKFVPSLDEDLARRDFKFNAMALRSDGSIYDPFGGKLDLYKKQIVSVGLPKDRIQEDPLRIFRAARFAAKYNFTIDPNFIGKARQLADRIFDVSVERWVQEMDKLLTSDYPNVGLNHLGQMGVLQRILPELYNYAVFDEPIRDADMAWKKLLQYVGTPDDIKEPTRTRRYINTGIISRLKFSNNRAKIILGDK